MHGQRSSDSGTCPVPVVLVAADPRRRTRRTPWRRVLVGVVLAAVLGGGAVATAGTLVSQRVAESFAVRDATADTAALARVVVEPALSDAVDDPAASARDRAAALTRLDDALAGEVRGGSTVRMKLWAADGTVLWSDEPRLVGERFPLSDEDLEALRTDRSDAEVSDLDEPENRYERGHGPLLEAYQAVHTPSGEALLFEAYRPYDQVLARAADLRAAFAALAFGTVGVVLVLLVPLLLWLLVRIRSGQRQRERLLGRALDAEVAERRRLARELHDGPVQDVAGLALSLGAVPETRAAATTLRAAVSSLRTSMSTIRPAAPERDGLRAALDDACARARGAGVETVLDVPDAVEASSAALTAAVRFVREAVWNAAQHARASRIDVRVRAVGSDLRVSVTDDGSGFDPALLDAPSRPGHLGTTLLREVAEDTGGALELRTAPGAGTTWQLTVPTATEALR
ncbi:sensor histidine kinase [Curtobacterium caseinilyticum]|uniref:Oxygen sensor histidine kinase NreB n=1 Tax=Curtobacterium caseinilyticum TaxID=3055137 RepID=A0ABT7TNT9_9MICO|nr:ATP-binding protein [Curtobacterium caseinilyticum]MDM7891262.1 ATP-binding protein [Curtobacterium caseinilyticum]